MPRVRDMMRATDPFPQGFELLVRDFGGDGVRSDRAHVYEHTQNVYTRTHEATMT
jgi:hypothetical protein